MRQPRPNADLLDAFAAYLTASEKSIQTTLRYKDAVGAALLVAAPEDAEGIAKYAGAMLKRSPRNAKLFGCAWKLFQRFGAEVQDLKVAPIQRIEQTVELGEQVRALLRATKLTPQLLRRLKWSDVDLKRFTLRHPLHRGFELALTVEMKEALDKIRDWACPNASATPLLPSVPGQPAKMSTRAIIALTKEPTRAKTAEVSVKMVAAAPAVTVAPAVTPVRTREPTPAEDPFKTPELTGL